MYEKAQTTVRRGDVVIPEYLDKNFMLYQQDGVALLSTLRPESIPLIWTNPSLEIRYLESKDVSKVAAAELCAATADAATRALTPDGLFIVCVSTAIVDDVVGAINKRTHLRNVAVFDGEYDSIVVFVKGNSDFVPVWADGNSPEATLASFIEMYTSPGDFVVDPFCGTGDVMEAAVKAGRIAVMNDLDPDAVTATVNRYKERCAK